MIRRLLSRLLYALLTGFIIAAAVVYALAGTAPGTRWLLDAAVRLGGLPLQVERSEGSLLGGLDLYGVRWHDAAAELRLAHVRLRWRPLDLLAGRLHLDELGAAHVLLVLRAQPATEAPAAGTRLPRIAVPLHIVLARLGIRDLVIVRGDQAWRIGSIRAHANLSGTRLQVGALRIATPQGGLQLVGATTLAPPYAGELRLAWTWHLVDGTRLAGQGTLSGNIDRIDLVQRLTAPFAAQLTGHVAPRSLSADLALDWQAARWPLQGTARLSSSHGRLTFKGTADAYAATLQGRLDGPEIPPADIALRATGDRRHVEVNALRVKALKGEVDGRGAFAWAPGLSWRASLHATGLDPAVRWPDWPGRLDFDLNATGTADSVEADLARLGGTLRGLPLTAAATARWRQNTLYLSSAELRAGGGHLRLSGRASASRGSLDLELDLPQIQNLLPAVRGGLKGRARIDGPWTWPRVTAAIQGKRLDWNGIQVRSAGLDIAPAAGDALNARLTLDELRRGGLTLKQVQARTVGRPARQRLSLQASSAEGRLSLAAEGGLGKAFDRWRGRLDSLRIAPAQGKAWRLDAPAAVDIGAKAQTLGEACLRPAGAADANLCVRLAAEAGRLDAAATLKALPLALLNPWLPSGMRLAGRLDGTGQLQGPADAPSGHLQARLDNGELRLRDANGEQTLPFAVPRLQATLRDGALEADARAELPRQQARIEAQARVARAQANGERPLSGSLLLDLPSLSALQPFVPQLHSLNGRAQARITLGGTLARPRIAGTASLDNGSAAVLATGTRLKHVRIRARMPENGDSLHFDASADSAPGSLQAKGDVRGLDSGQPRLAMQVSGTNFQAVDLPQVQARVSPRLDIEADPARIKVRGKVEVPEAKIRVQRLPAKAVGVSPDVEIVGQTPKHRQGLLLDAEIELLLGDKVSIDAFGLSGNLKGSLLLHQQDDAPTTADGSLNISDGTYSAYGLNLALSRGVLNFAGPVDNPGLDVVAERQSGTVTAKLAVTGTLKSPRSEVSADPPMSQADALSWLLTGHGINQASRSDAALLLRAVYSMNVADNGGGLVSQLEQRTGLSEISVQGGDTLQQSALVLGKYLTPDLYVRYTTGLFERANTLALTYRLTHHLSVEAQSGAAQALDLLYQIEFGGR